MLLLGPLGPPHVADQALGLLERGLDVRVGGDSPEELEDSVLQEAGVPVSTSPEAARSTPWGIAGTVRWARRLVRETQPDVVNAHWLPGFGFAAAAASINSVSSMLSPACTNTAWRTPAALCSSSTSPRS